jgi:uridine kinase
VILDGLFAFWDPRLRALMDLKIFVDAASDIRLIRRLHRDLEERGRTVESILRQYTESVRPMHQRYVEPLKAHADLVLDTTERPLEESLAEIDRALAKMRGSFRGSTGA